MNEMNFNDTPIVEEQETFETETEEVVQDEFETEETPSEELEELEQQEVKPFNFELQYNKEKVIIDNEEKLRELAQKGMNYEKVQSKVKEYEMDPLRQWAYEYMKENNFEDPSQFLEAIKADREQRAIEAKINELMQNDGFTEAQARRIAEAEKKAEEVNKKFAERENNEKQQKEYSDFLSWHDSMREKGVFKEQLDPNKIPPEVWSQVEQGTPLKTAYMEYELTNVKTNTEQEVIKNIQKNSKTAPGSVRENTTVNDTPWTTEYIEAMAQKHGTKWVNANYEKIQKSGYYN